MPCTLPASLADAAVCRGSFHAVLGGEAGEAVFADFSAALQKAQAEGRILTASLLRYENQLFFYAEGLNRPFTPQGLCPALDTPCRRMRRSITPASPRALMRLPAAPPGTHCPAAARQMVQLYGAPSAHRHRGAGRGGPLAPDLCAGGRTVFLS